jgi:hypothetical protein
MFGYEFKAGFEKKNKRNQPLPYQSTEPYRMTPEETIHTVKGIVKELVVGAVLTFGAIVAINTISEIATNRLGNPSQKELEN